ncbi:MAG: hypothetical protein MMC33_003328 [Icmadophila ericetorum]|nr:hypothetical protein [Icmadophila ericetorum]
MKYNFDPTNGNHATNYNIIMWWEEYESFAIIQEILEYEYNVDATVLDIFAVVYASIYSRATADWIYDTFRWYGVVTLRRILIFRQE